MERAIIRRGKYRFKDDYLHLEVSEDKWFGMNQAQRQAHFKKVALAKVIVEPIACTSAIPQTLSMDIDEVALKVNLPLPCLSGIWQKAESLHNSTVNIVPAPGHPSDARMVASQSGQRPHLVLPVAKAKGGSYKCDSDCLNYKSLGLCSHVVAVANLNGSLPQLISVFCKTKKRPDFTKLAVHGMPSGRGKKGTQAPRRRKKAEPVSERAQRISTSSSDSLAPSSVPNPQTEEEIHNSATLALWLILMSVLWCKPMA